MAVPNVKSTNTFKQCTSEQEVHNLLFVRIKDELTTDNFGDLKQLLRELLGASISEETDKLKVLNRLENEGIISLGYYENLKKLLTQAGCQNICNTIEQAEKRILRLKRKASKKRKRDQEESNSGAKKKKDGILNDTEFQESENERIEESHRGEKRKKDGHLNDTEFQEAEDEMVENGVTSDVETCEQQNTQCALEEDELDEEFHSRAKKRKVGNLNDKDFQEAENERIEDGVTFDVETCEQQNTQCPLEEDELDEETKKFCFKVFNKCSMIKKIQYEQSDSDEELTKSVIKLEEMAMKLSSPKKRKRKDCKSISKDFQKGNVLHAKLHSKYLETKQIAKIADMHFTQKMLGGLSQFKQAADKFIKRGAHLIKLTEGCVDCTLMFDDAERLQNFWTEYKSGDLSQFLTHEYITADLEEMEEGKRLYVDVYICEQELAKAWDFFTKPGEPDSFINEAVLPSTSGTQIKYEQLPSSTSCMQVKQEQIPCTSDVQIKQEQMPSTSGMQIKQEQMPSTSGMQIKQEQMQSSEQSIKEEYVGVNSQRNKRTKYTEPANLKMSESWEFIFNSISARVSHIWKEMAVYLGISEEEIQRIVTQFTEDQQEQCTECLSRFLERNLSQSPEQTTSHLITALYRMNQPTFAETVIDLLKLKGIPVDIGSIQRPAVCDSWHYDAKDYEKDESDDDEQHSEVDEKDIQNWKTASEDDDSWKDDGEDEDSSSKISDGNIIVEGEENMDTEDYESTRLENRDINDEMTSQLLEHGSYKEPSKDAGNCTNDYDKQITSSDHLHLQQSKNSETIPKTQSLQQLQSLLSLEETRPGLTADEVQNIVTLLKDSPSNFKQLDHTQQKTLASVFLSVGCRSTENTPQYRALKQQILNLTKPKLKPFLRKELLSMLHSAETNYPRIFIENWKLLSRIQEEKKEMWLAIAKC